MSQYVYYPGSQSVRETVTFDITRRGQYITTCVVDVYLLICGIKAFPCGNGDDEKLTAQQRLEILELVREERGKIAARYPVKTYKGWMESGLPTFDEYCAPGDEVDEEMVDYFVNVVPPVLMRSTCTQAGEPYSHERDERGRYRATYTTFHRTEGGWQFDGYCFYGENKNQHHGKSSLEERIEKTRREVEGDG